VLRDLGREQPDRFALCLDTLEARVKKRQAGQAPPPARRIKKITVPGADLFEWLMREGWPMWLEALPDGFAIEGCWVDQGGKNFTLTIRSRTFPPVAEGDAVPTIDWESMYS
jgi:hypothetical protein